MCVMELAAYLSPTSGFTDHPVCVSPVIGSFLRSWNDSLADEPRQMLKPYAVQVLNTATTKKDEETRAWLATDWLARECAPAFLRCAGLTAQAELLEALAPLTSAESARKAQPTLDKTRKDAYAARAAARDAARDAAWDAARDAARDAAWDAARAAARAAAWDAARAAARAAVEPTVKLLQPSALLLLDRMIAVGKAA
jgi:hypothetical protein